MQAYTEKSATVGARQGWSRLQRKRWVLAKTREQREGDLWAGSSTGSHN